MVRLDQASRELFMPMERRAADAERRSVMKFCTRSDLRLVDRELPSL
jgi:hypothetical protein